MKGNFITSLILSTLCTFGDALLLNAATLESPQSNAVSETDESLLAQIRGRGSTGSSRDVSRSRNSGGSGANLQRERSNSNRVNRSSNVDRTQTRQSLQNVDRTQTRQSLQNVDRTQTRQSLQNVDQRNVENRLQNANINRNDVTNRANNNNINLNSDRNFSNRIERNNINNRVNISNNNVVINPRGSNYRGWGWNGGRIWYPTTGCWGGCFWGSFTAGAVTGLVTGAAINSLSNNNQPQYIIVQQNTPGSRLLLDYGLTQTACRDDVVIIFGPENSKICAFPNNFVPAGIYFIDTENFTIISL